MAKLHFTAPYQLVIRGEDDPRPFWRWEDMREACAILDEMGRRYVRYDRASDGTPRPLDVAPYVNHNAPESRS